MSLGFGESSVWWNAMFKCYLENTFAPDISFRVSSMVGTGRFSLSIAWLVCLMSRYMRTSPFTSTATTGLIQLVVPFTSSVTSSVSSSSNLATTFCFLLNGILQMAWAIGVTLSSTCSFNWKFFNYLGQVNTCRYFAFRVAFSSLEFSFWIHQHLKIYPLSEHLILQRNFSLTTCRQCLALQKIGPQCVLGVLCLNLFLSDGMLFSNIRIWELNYYKWKVRQVITTYKWKMHGIVLFTYFIFISNNSLSLLCKKGVHGQSHVTEGKFWN